MTKIAPQAEMSILYTRTTNTPFSEPLSRGQAFGQLNPEVIWCYLLQPTGFAGNDVLNTLTQLRVARAASYYL